MAHPRVMPRRASTSRTASTNRSSGTAIKFSPDAVPAQEPHHALVVGHAVAVQHRDYYGAGRRLRIDLAKMHEGSEQARHSNGEAGRWHWLTAEARHEAVIAAAATDGAEADG